MNEYFDYQIRFDEPGGPMTSRIRNKGYLQLVQKVLNEDKTVVFIDEFLPYIKDAINEILTGVGKTEQQVIERKYGLKDRQAQSLSEIAQILHIQSKKINEYEIQVLDYMRRPCSRSILSAFTCKNHTCEEECFSAALNTENRYGEIIENWIITEATFYRRVSSSTETVKIFGVSEKLFDLVNKEGTTVIHAESNNLNGEKTNEEAVASDRRRSCFYDRKKLKEEILSFPTNSGNGIPITRCDISPLEMLEMISLGCLYTDDLLSKMPTVLYESRINKKTIQKIGMQSSGRVAIVRIPKIINDYMIEHDIRTLDKLKGINARNNKELKRMKDDLLDEIKLII